MLWVTGALALLLVAGLSLWCVAPREAAVTDIRFDESQLSGGVSAYLAERERAIPDLRPGVEKRVIWAEAPETRSDWAVVYVHGFSASSEELRPMPDIVAGRLDANLVFTRLQGHGRDGAAMGQASVADWMGDVAEALAVGRAVGGRLLVIGCSTGCTLLTLALHEEMSSGVAGCVFVSPNYRPRATTSRFLTWPGARWLLRWLIGRQRGFVPHNAAHGRYWTARYPSIALLPMAAAVKAAERLPHEAAKVPALFVFDPGDSIVDHAATRAVAARWGAAAEVFEVETGEGEDPGRHVIAGDILSPGMTRPVADRITAWVRALG